MPKAASMNCASVSVTSGGSFDAPAKQERVAEIDHLSSQTGFWDDQARAQEILRERNQAKSVLDDLNGVLELCDDAEVMLEMAEEDEDALIETASSIKEADRRVSKMEFKRMLGGAHDKGNCFISINAGAGGTESQDWAQMLLRMLLRFCERRSWRVELTEELAGEEAGIKSATFRVEGDYAFGYLKAENGVHRLVCQGGTRPRRGRRGAVWRSYRVPR